MPPATKIVQRFPKDIQGALGATLGRLWISTSYLVAEIMVTLTGWLRGYFLRAGI